MTTGTHEAARGKVVDRAQYALAAFIGIVGAYVVYDASTLTKAFSEQPIQPYVFPYVIGTGLLVLAVLLAVSTARGDLPEAEEGEDIDLSVKADWVTVAKLGAVFVANIALIDWLGWAITGALLFVGSARVLGSQTLIRDVAVGIVLSVGSFYGFRSGLGLAVPAGILEGIL